MAMSLRLRDGGQGWGDGSRVCFFVCSFNSVARLLNINPEGQDSRNLCKIVGLEA